MQSFFQGDVVWVGCWIEWQICVCEYFVDVCGVIVFGEFCFGFFFCCCDDDCGFDYEFDVVLSVFLLFEFVVDFCDCVVDLFE